MGGLIASLLGVGGPSAAMQSTSADQANLASEFMNDFSQMYNLQLGDMATLRNAYAPIISLGPNQHGFSSDVLNSLNTQLINSTGAAYKNTSAAARNAAAGQGGGGGNTSGLTSGIQSQIDAAIASNFSNSLTAGQTKIQLEDYATGRQNWQTALSGENALLGRENPQGFGSMAGNELGAAYGTESNIKQLKDQQTMGLVNGIAGLAVDAATFGAGGFGALGSGESFGEGLGDFFAGGANALGGNFNINPGTPQAPLGLGQDNGQ